MTAARDLGANHVGAAALHLRKGLGGQDVRGLAPDHRERETRQQVEEGPKIGQRRSLIGQERVPQAWIVYILQIGLC